MPTVKFVNEKKTIEVPEGANLRKEAMKAGVEVYSGIHKVIHCPGIGCCGSCRVKITKGTENVSRQSWREKLRFLAFFPDPMAFFHRLGQEQPEQLRLSCQTRVRGDVEVETHPPMNWHGDRFWG